jgi:hypothetical protein
MPRGLSYLSLDNWWTGSRANLSPLGDCQNLSICSNVQITKYLNVSNHHQISSKSWNLWVFCLNLEEKMPCQDRLLLSKFVSTLISAKLPIFQIYNIHVHTLGNLSQQSICWRHISLDVCVREWVTKCKLRHIFSSIFAKISIYLLKMGGWNESGMIWM